MWKSWQLRHELKKKYRGMPPLMTATVPQRGPNKDSPLTI